MKIIITGMSVVLSSLLFATVIHAQEDVLSQGQSCANVQNDLERLVCYDAIFKSTENKVLGSSINKPSSVQASIERPQAGEADSASANAGGDSLEAKIERFGAKTDPDTEELSRIDSVITGISKNRYGVRTFTLSNGHVWRENTAGRAMFKEGMDIYIEKGALSSHFLGREGSSRRVRVKRVN